jgi:hypothetical protein
VAGLTFGPSGVDPAGITVRDVFMMIDPGIGLAKPMALSSTLEPRRRSCTAGQSTSTSVINQTARIGVPDRG